MQLPDWQTLFRLVCNRGRAALEWDFIEPWIHAELFAESKRQALSSGWEPFSIEAPYVTLFPVRLPKKENRDQKTGGAIKWADLCLRAREGNLWCWLEFKVRHTSSRNQKPQTSKAARDAFCKDIVALIGFDINATADKWANPDRYTVSYEQTLRPNADDLRSGKHYFAAAFLQLKGGFDSVLWGQNILSKKVGKWFSHRNKEIGWQGSLPDFAVQPYEFDNHSLAICEWTIREVRQLSVVLKNTNNDQTKH